MRKGIISVALLLAVPAIYADNSDGACDAVHEIASNVMSARQNGVSVRRAMELMGGTQIGTDIVLDAYKETRWNSESSKERAVTEFANDYYLECVEAFSDE